MGSRLNEKKVLASGVTFSWYKHREKEFAAFYSAEDNVVYCKDIPRLMRQHALQYEPSQWRLFMDSSQLSLKAVLLHNGNHFASLPVAYSSNMKENYTNSAVILLKIRYVDNACS